MRGGRTVEVTELARFLEKWVVLIVYVGGEIYLFIYLFLGVQIYYLGVFVM